jgi:glycosyltransferase involved in cell wall biosynthesis
MQEKTGYLKKEERKKILLLCDDIRVHSGVGTMAKEIVLATAHRYNWVNLGAAVKHQEEGSVIDLSEDTAKETGIEDASVKIYPSTGYGDPFKLRKLLKDEKPDAIFIFTDPRYWVWLFDMEREIRSKIPIFYLNIWDNYPAPMYNKPYYESVDLLMAISKQTKLINELVLGDKAKDKVIKYVPHGVNEKYYFPIDDKYEDWDKFVEFKKEVFKGKDIQYVVFFNSRNIHRKKVEDLILGYRYFCDAIGQEAAKKCALVMHTQVVDQNGTDLLAVKEALCDPSYVNVLFSADRLNTAQMNLLYNLADVTVLPSSNEGWGLALTESMMTGTMFIANVTGGMQDQMRFSKDGKWVDPTKDLPSNHEGTITECGEWAIPVFPSNRSLVGSPQTPYIFDDRCSADSLANAIENVYNMSSEERSKRGKAGREWVLSDEAMMTSENMGKNVIAAMDEAFDKFTPRKKYDIIKVEKLETNYIQHKLRDYSYE